MDVVRTNINKLNGTINIESTKGKGTTIEILIPLTVAIMPAMIVEIGSHLYSIPLQSIEEIVVGGVDSRRVLGCLQTLGHGGIGILDFEIESIESGLAHELTDSNEQLLPGPDDQQAQQHKETEDDQGGSNEVGTKHRLPDGRCGLGQIPSELLPSLFGTAGGGFCSDGLRHVGEGSGVIYGKRKSSSSIGRFLFWSSMSCA